MGTHSLASHWSGSRILTANLQLNMRAAILLLVVLALAVDLSAAAKKKRPRKKFCPQEVGTDRCNAKQSQYKCGVFYKDLLKSRPLTYIGALPDDLTDKNKGSWQAILGPNARKKVSVTLTVTEMLTDEPTAAVTQL